MSEPEAPEPEPARVAFEAWITAPPIEAGIARQSADGAWPGQYVAYDVQLAWEAWQAGQTAPLAREAQLHAALVEAFYDPDPVDPEPVDFSKADWVAVIEQARKTVDRLQAEALRLSTDLFKWQAWARQQPGAPEAAAQVEAHAAWLQLQVTLALERIAELEARP